MIIYFDNGNNTFSSQFNDCGYQIISPYNNKLKVKLIKKLDRIKLLGDILYNSKEIHPNPNESIIIFDSNITVEFLRWICYKFPHNRKIFWYWNPVESETSTIQPSEILDGIECWSYSPTDCEKYGLQYNTTFYFDSILGHSAITEQRRRTTLFIGRDKGRLNKLIQLKEQFEACGMKCEFHIIGDVRATNYKYEKAIPYSQVIQLINQAEVLVDYYVDATAGLSLRPMEALFLNKKLITNNKTIKCYDFYNKDNIFMLEHDSESERLKLRKFIGRKYVEIDSSIRDRYLFSNWIERFSK